MIEKITKWIDNYSELNNIKSLVVGISGGIDSSVVSTLCARTNRPVHVVSMPLNQIKNQHDLSISHGLWLKKKFSNINHYVINLDELYKKFHDTVSENFNSELAFANSKSRLRMVVLHQISASKNGQLINLPLSNHYRLERPIILNNPYSFVPLFSKYLSVKNSVRKAIKMNKIAHIGLHPIDFGMHSEKYRQHFERLLRFISDSRDRHEIDIITMSEILDT